MSLHFSNCDRDNDTGSPDVFETLNESKRQLVQLEGTDSQEFEIMECSKEMVWKCDPPDGHNIVRTLIKLLPSTVGKYLV